METARIAGLARELRDLIGAQDLVNVKFLAAHRPGVSEEAVLRQLIEWIKADRDLGYPNSRVVG